MEILGCGRNFRSFDIQVVLLFRILVLWDYFSVLDALSAPHEITVLPLK